MEISLPLDYSVSGGAEPLQRQPRRYAWGLLQIRRVKLRVARHGANGISGIRPTLGLVEHRSGLTTQRQSYWTGAVSRARRVPSLNQKDLSSRFPGCISTDSSRSGRSISSTPDLKARSAHIGTFSGRRRYRWLGPSQERTSASEHQIHQVPGRRCHTCHVRHGCCLEHFLCALPTIG